MVNSMTDIMKQAEADVKAADSNRDAAVARATAAQADAVAAQKHAEEMHAVREWLRRLHSEPTEPDVWVETARTVKRTETAPATRFGKPVPEVALTDLCRQALEDLGGTARNRQICDRLVRDGHDVNLDKVRSSLAYLSRKTPPVVATDPGSGIWRLLHVNTSRSFVPAVTVPVNGTGGES